MKNILLGLLRFYKRKISPNLKSACRFSPTCSEYAQTAIERYGAGKGSLLALRRILRCNPLFKGGYDPVPEDETTTFRRN
ncbi:MAG: membrane protein insertion efficiency factor YidD [Eubacteriales bacterium]|nr:membrane protein insertion efficiency factor YidD [Eubacteriales bacterium]